MTETVPKNESSPGGRLIVNAEKFRYRNKQVVEGPRPDTAISDDLGGGTPIRLAAAQVRKNGPSMKV